MELIYVLSLECFFTLCAFQAGGPRAGIAVCLATGLCAAFFSGKNKAATVIFPLLLAFRILTFVNFGEYATGDRVSLGLELLEGRGRIARLDGKAPRRKSYAKVGYLRDGRYALEGTITKIEDFRGTRTYTIEKSSATEIPPNALSRYFTARAEALLEKAPIDFRNLYMAVVLGDTSRLDRGTREKFSYTGTSHLLALSGLHIGIVFSFILFEAGKLPLMRRKRYLLALLAITLYFAGVKNSPSLSRAYIMVLVTIAGKIFYENVDAEKSLCASFLWSMFADPLSAGETSLKLSYLAVVAIVSVFPRIKERVYPKKSRWIDLFLLTLVIQLFLTPVMVWEFGALPFLALFSNLVMLPLGSLYISLAFGCLMLQNFGLGFLLLWAAELVFKVFTGLLGALSKLPWLTLPVKSPASPLLLYLFYGLCFALILWIKYRNENMRFRGTGLVIRGKAQKDI